jgi:hypothetical protein
MCKYFSCIGTKDGKVYFYHGNEHDEIIKRAGLKDDSLESRDFVRIEVPDGDMKQYRIDEQGTLPRWFEKRENDFYKKVEVLLSKVNPLKPKWDAIYAEYKTKRKAIDAEYKPKRDAIDAEYKTKWDAIYAEYKPKRDAIDAEYQTKKDANYAEYQTKRAAIYKGIKGYLGESKQTEKSRPRYKYPVRRGMCEG